MNETNLVILLTGPPGAGKGTQAATIAAKFGWHTFSIGQLLRDTAPIQIKKRIAAGELLPKEYVVSAVVDRIKNSDRPVLVDGFPRRLDQAEEFDQAIAKLYRADQIKVLLLNVDKDESWQRVAGRGREDDERSVWENRWQEYYLHTVPAEDHYRRTGQLVEIDGNGSVETVTAAIESTLATQEIFPYAS